MTPRERDIAGNASRKEQILDAAATLFANNGFYKTTTAMVADVVGVTQPYVFHFFKSKESLYLAVLERAKNRLIQAFSSVEAPPEQLEYQLGNAFSELMATHRDEILLCMQSFATPEPHIREFARKQFVYIHELVSQRFERAGIPDADRAASSFIACGMAITISVVLEAPQLGLMGETEASPGRRHS